MEDKKEKFLAALRQGYGIIATACEAVGIGRSTYYRWYNADQEFRAQVDEVTETQVDFVESKLIQAIRAGDTTATIFYLKTKGKKRGYSEKALPKVAESMLYMPPKVTESAVVRAESIAVDAEVKRIAAKVGIDIGAESADEARKRIAAEPADEARKRMAAKVKSKKAYIVKLLKEQGKYTAELTYQVDITAKLLVRADMVGDEIMADGHRTVNVEYSREGNERKTIDPRERLYVELLEKGQKALRALGMNTESKERRSSNDELNDFLAAVKPEEDE